MRRALYLAAMSSAVLTVAAAAVATAQEETPKEIVAAQVRTMGFPCDAALGVERVSTVPNAAVWILRCRNATYRVHLTPNMGARVEPIR
jgi:hypothetical protein